MSVINRMLQELESRHEQPQARLPGIVRAVPPPARSGNKLVLLVVLGVVLLGGVAFWVWHSFSAQLPVEQRPGSMPPAATAVPERVPHTPEPVWPQPLQAPTETLVSQTALAPKPATKSLEPAHLLVKALPAQERPAPQGPVAEVAPKPTEPAVVKSAPSAVAEVAPPGGMKQISPAQRADQRYREALALISQGRMGEAQTALEEVLKMEPHHLGGRQVLLGILVDGKRFAQAEQLLQDGLALNIAPGSLAMALARLQMERGDQNAALDTLDRYLAQGQGSADYQAFFGALLQRMERHSEAIPHYQAALRLQPNRAVWWMGLGISLQAEKRTADAEQAFARARALPGLTAELQAFVDQRLKQLQQAR